MVAAEEVATAGLPLATPLGGLRLTVETPSRIRVTGGQDPEGPRVMVGGVAVQVDATLTYRTGRTWKVPAPAKLRVAPVLVGSPLPRGARGAVREVLEVAVTGWVLAHPLVVWAVADQAIGAEQQATQRRLEEVQAARRRLAANRQEAAEEQRAALGREIVELEVEASRLRAKAGRLDKRRRQLAWLRP